MKAIAVAALTLAMSAFAAGGFNYPGVGKPKAPGCRPKGRRYKAAVTPPCLVAAAFRRAGSDFTSR